jgi:hypothetical protein
MLLPGARVWVRNPYPQDDDAAAYRARWLPAGLSSRPPWVPGVVQGAAAALDGGVRVRTLLEPPLDLVVRTGELEALNPVTA